MRRIPVILLPAFAMLCAFTQAEDARATKHYGFGMAWLNFDYPADFAIDPASHAGEAKWWAKFVSPDGTFSIESNSFGYVHESELKGKPYKSAGAYVIGTQIGKDAEKKDFGRFLRFVEKAATGISVHYVLKSAFAEREGRCYLTLDFKFPAGTYEAHKPVIDAVLQSARPWDSETKPQADAVEKPAKAGKISP